jgi:HK97 family phage major capsid protein/HK97 family phage prohead protease
MSQLHYAHALLTVKRFEPSGRSFAGIATDGMVDRQGDVVEPLGAQFKNPLPLLLHHDSAAPVGLVTLGKPTKDGIPFTAEIPTITEPGRLKERTDEAAQSVAAGLIRGVSIGFRSLKDAVEQLATGGMRFLKFEILELSMVSIPANQHATIQVVKQFDCEPAATGTGLDVESHHAAGVPAVSTPRVLKGARLMAQTYSEQIANIEAKFNANKAQQDAIFAKSGAEGRSTDEAEGTQFDDLDAENERLIADLGRLRKLDKAAREVATPLVMAEHQNPLARPPVSIQVKSNLPKGTAFARMCIALARGKGDSYQTLQIAKGWKDSTPEVETMIEHMWQTKSAVAAGTTADATWAGPLVVTQPLNEFLELLRPRTLLGQIPGLRMVPFNVSVPSQTTGGTYGWVGEGLAKPVTSAAYAAVTVPFAKAAGIIVLTEELVKLSTPSAENLVREEMIAGMAQFLDLQFVDPAKAVDAGVSPASITNGASTAAASGATAAAAKLDLAASVAIFTAANIPLAGSVWLMNDSNAFGIAMSLNALGQQLFPGMSASGGSIFGIPVIVSNNVGARIILVHAPSILVADEGGVRVDVSREASVQMDTAPDSPATATTVLVSLWQNNLVGLRAERMITWKRARTAAVRYITSAAYTGA